MQTPAEKHLVQSIITLLGSGDAGDVAPILNIGAGKSVVIENQLSEAGVRYRCDRVDVDDCSVEHPSVDKCWTCSVERMDPVASDAYTVAFTNYVLEHVAELNRAATEIYRVLRPEGVFLASVPNTLAPEFWLSRRTPLRFHKWLRRGDAWETQYAYKNVADLAAIFERHGFSNRQVRYFPFVRGYTDKFPVIRFLGKQYDKLVSSLGAQRLMGNVCVIFQKPLAR